MHVLLVDLLRLIGGNLGGKPEADGPRARLSASVLALPFPARDMISGKSSLLVSLHDHICTSLTTAYSPRTVFYGSA